MRRRRCCEKCGARFTTLERIYSKLPRTPAQLATNNGALPSPRSKLSTDDVLAIFFSDPKISNRKLAERFQVTAQTIADVRRGRTHRKLIEAQAQQRLCVNCEHWSLARYCYFGFPDPDEIGPAAARDCDNFVFRSAAPAPAPTDPTPPSGTPSAAAARPSRRSPHPPPPAVRVIVAASRNPAASTSSHRLAC